MADNTDEGKGGDSLELYPAFLESFKDQPVEGDFQMNDEEDDDAGDKGAPTADEIAAAEKKEEEEKARLEEEDKNLSPEDKAKKVADKEAADLEAKNKAEQDKGKKPEELEAERVKEYNKKAEDGLLSRFEGKYKSVDEIVEKLSAPPQEVFASDFIKHLNDLEKAGVKIDQDYVNALTVDYDSMENPVEILMENLKQSDPKYKNWTPAELEFEVRHQYRMDEWAEEGEEANEVEKIYSTRQIREAQEAVSKMKEKQSSLKNIPVVDPKIALQAAEDKRLQQEGYEKYIDNEVTGKIEKLSVPLADGKTFDYEIDPEIKAEAGKLMKEMGPSVNAFWKQFKGADGKFNTNKVYEMIVRDRLFDKVAKLAHEQGKAAGGETEHRNLSNANFDTKQQSGNKKSSGSFEEAASKSLAENF